MEAKSFRECGIMQSKITFIGLAALLALLVIAAGCLGQQQPGKPGEEGKGNERSRAIDSFTTCVDAGYPVMESYPRQCRTPDGQTFAEEIDHRFCGGIAVIDAPLQVVDPGLMPHAPYGENDEPKGVQQHRYKFGFLHGVNENS